MDFLENLFLKSKRVLSTFNNRHKFSVKLIYTFKCLITKKNYLNRSSPYLRNYLSYLRRKKISYHKFKLLMNVEFIFPLNIYREI